MNWTLIATIFLWFGFLRAQDITPQELSQRLDRIYRANSSVGEVVMHIKTPHYERSLKLKIWSKGKDLTLIRILEPRKEKGTSTLKREQEMWNYLPKIKKTIRIPPSLMMGSWMGSDFNNDDLVRESSWELDYDMAFGVPASEDEWLIVSTAKEDAPVSWPKVESVFNKKTMMPVSQTYFNEKNEAVRRMEFTDLKEFSGRKIPARMTLRPLNKEGNLTELIYEFIEFNVELDDAMFSLQELQRGR